ncbi:MAG: hypothetical protein GEU92_19030 [Alphaproteobacteria bacterium]|nr:hypothetical protein [Alphaproteobacteria bacterium]
MADLYTPASPYGDPYGGRERDRTKSQRDALAELLAGGGKSRFFGVGDTLPQPAITVGTTPDGSPVKLEGSGGLGEGINSAGKSFGDAFSQPPDSQSQGTNISPSNLRTGYDTYQKATGGQTSTDWLTSLFGGGGGAAAGPGMLAAVPGGSGFGSATGGAASSMGVAAVPGGVSNAAVTGAGSSGTGSGFLGGLFGGGGGGGAGAGGAAGLGVAALPLAIFAGGMLGALHLENKDAKKLKTKRSLYTPEDKARIAKDLARRQQAYRDKQARDRLESNDSNVSD